MEQAGGISIHAMDIATGRVAAGLNVELHRLEPSPALVAAGEIGANGLLDHASARGAGVVAGLYEVRFDLGAFFARTGRDAPFLDEVPFRFRVRNAAEHYHLPFKFTPYGFSLFRGA
ncbi:MAG: 5-hydroxyisourate hydrolase [Methylobacterium sp.]|nr:MAG: 5-hydroxyisourate hydrolase [Methylobacterium sp.]